MSAVHHPTLSRPRSDRIFAGVCAGIARRFDWNATLTRILFVVLSLASVAFPGILFYLLLWLLMPESDD